MWMFLCTSLVLRPCPLWTKVQAFPSFLTACSVSSGQRIKNNDSHSGNEQDFPTHSGQRQHVDGYSFLHPRDARRYFWIITAVDFFYTNQGGEDRNILGSMLKSISSRFFCRLCVMTNSDLFPCIGIFLRAFANSCSVSWHSSGFHLILVSSWFFSSVPVSNCSLHVRFFLEECLSSCEPDGKSGGLVDVWRNRPSKSTTQSSQKIRAWSSSSVNVGVLARLTLCGGNQRPSYRLRGQYSQRYRHIYGKSFAPRNAFDRNIGVPEKTYPFFI